MQILQPSLLSSPPLEALLSWTMETHFSRTISEEQPSPLTQILQSSSPPSSPEVEHPLLHTQKQMAPHLNLAKPIISMRTLLPSLPELSEALALVETERKPV